MRTIKFRTIYKRENSIVIKHYIIGASDEEKLSGSEWINAGFKIIDRNLSTELYDKNKKEIYGGDCLGGVWGMTYIDWCEEQGGWEIFTCEKECMACMGDVHWNEIVEDKEKEIIGNIYENPELLK